VACNGKIGLLFFWFFVTLRCFLVSYIVKTFSGGLGMKKIALGIFTAIVILFLIWVFGTMIYSEFFAVKYYC
jgi:hypothetical protein